MPKGQYRVHLPKVPWDLSNQSLDPTKWSFGDFCFIICLWMHHRGETVNELQILIEIIERCIIKLLAIVIHDHPRQAKQIDD